jgi:predicted class III extradiol MEMO1 family dioxygenase
MLAEQQRNMGIYGEWDFIKYAQSFHVTELDEGSVSYVSGYWLPDEQGAVE